MAMMNRSIPNMFNGVSQQPPALRLPSQANIQENGTSSVVDGISKRPPTTHVAKFTDKTTEEIYIHTINRDKFSQYVVMIENGELYVYTLDGKNIPVDYPDGKTYLASTAPQDDFAAVTVADYTFIVNKTIKVIRNEGAVAPGELKGSVQLFVDLPTEEDDEPPEDGDIWEIAGSGSNNFDNYYVKKVGDVWRETVKPGLVTHFGEYTMPFALVDEGTGRFTFKRINWDPRYVGDDLSAKFPSFIGATISDVFFHRNRLGFLSKENVIFSRSGEFFNFFPETVTTILDTDPVDVAVSHNKVATLKHAASFNTSLMLFSDQAQFQLTAKDVLTPKTAAINVTTEYNVNTKVTPISAGTSLYFAVTKGDSTSIKEYEVQPLTYNNEAADVTAHCPTYIPSDIYKLVGSDLENMIIGLCKSNRSTLYVYKYYWATPDEKVQSSWSKFVLDPNAKILNADFVDNMLYLVVQRADGNYLETMDFTYRQKESNLNYLAHLDHKTEAMGNYDAVANTTYFTVPYPTTGTGWQGVLGNEWSSQYPPPSVTNPTYSKPISRIGGRLKLTPAGNYTLSCPGNWTQEKLIIGREYLFKYQLSPIYYKDSQKIAVPHYKMNLKNMHLFYDYSGFFKVTVDLPGGQQYIYTLQPKIGSDELEIGNAHLDSGNFRFPIFGDGEETTITIESDSMFPMSIQGAEYEAQITSYSRHQ